MRRFIEAWRAAVVMILASGASAQTPLGSAFTYQGELRQSGAPATGAADLRFRLYTAQTAGSQVGNEVAVNGAPLSAGRFGAALDFGAAAFGPDARWLEIDVRVPAGSGAFVTLTPRQRVTPAPAAQYAAEAGSAANATQLNGQSPSFYQNASNLSSGTLASGLLAGSYTGAVTFGNASNSFSGSGAGLSGLNASNVTGGTLADARLSANVAFLTGSQTFTGSKAFSGGFSTSAFTLSPGAGAGRVLTSDASGNGSWAIPSVPNPLTLIGSAPSTWVLGGQNTSPDPNSIGVLGVLASTAGNGSGRAAVRGQNQSQNGSGVGVWGSHAGSGWGVFGDSVDGYGVIGSVSGTSAQNSGVWGQSASLNGRGVVGYATAFSGNTSFGVVGQSDSTGGSGVFGYVPFGTGSSGVFGQSDGGNGTGVKGVANNGTFAAGVVGLSTSGRGVYAESSAWGGAGIYAVGTADNSTGVFGRADVGSTSVGVRGWSASGWGVSGNSTAADGVGVIGEAHSGITARGVWGYSTSGWGVFGSSTATGGQGVRGESPNFGVYGYSGTTGGIGVRGFVLAGTGNAGVSGMSTASNGNGVIGDALSGGSAYGVWARAPQATGLYCQGALTATGTKAFRIDHPADPENKYLMHYCAEGPAPQNIYNGVATLDERGEAMVMLPPYFASINTDPRYALTAVGAPMPMLHIARKIDQADLAAGAAAGPGDAIPGVFFLIAGGAPGGEVSWEVKAVRNDLYTRHYGAPVEVDKTDKDRDTYQHPELYGQPRERIFGFTPDLRQDGGR